jgi:CubicO group peptidase (beta-lactamase class C family)
MNKSIFICLVVAFIVSCSQQNIKLPKAKPEQVGMSSDHLNQVKSLIHQYVDENKLPGLIAMVSRHGKVVCFEKYGLMGADKPMQLNAIFRMASMTKPITSVAVMMLYEEGYFKLDDPVEKYIAEFKNLKVFSYKDGAGIHVEDQKKLMTIGDLLKHTSGIASGGENSLVDSIYRKSNLSDGTLKDMVQKLAKIPLKYQPGTQWQYSRSTDVLAYLVEVISGKPFNTFLKEKIFIPLKMNDTDYNVPNEKLNRVCAVYSRGDSSGIKILNNPEINNLSTPVKFFSGNGGLVSTATDYMIFSQMLLNKGEYNGVRLLESKTVDLMTSNHISNEIMPYDNYFGPLLKGMGFGYGFAVLLDTNKSKIIGSNGSYWWSGSANTYFFIDPKEDLIMILMTQFVPNYYYPINREFRELVYKSIIH